MTGEACLKTSKLKAWAISTRPKTLILSVFPFALGTILASAEVRELNLFLLASASLSALSIQIATNLINDAFDVKKGADTEKREGPLRGVQEGALSVSQVYKAGLAMLLLALIFGIPLIVTGGIPIALLLIVSLLCAYIYTGGPMPLAYHGLGELFVILFFGLASSGVAFYFQTGYLSFESLLLGLQLGILAAVPIAINNLRDLAGDAKVNKKTLAVRFGKTFARREISFLLLAPFLLNFLWTNTGMRFLPILALPLAWNIAREIWTKEPGKVYNNFLALSVLLYVIFGLLLTAGFFYENLF